MVEEDVVGFTGVGNWESRLKQNIVHRGRDEMENGEWGIGEWMEWSVGKNSGGRDERGGKGKGKGGCKYEDRGEGKGRDTDKGKRRHSQHVRDEYAHGFSLRGTAWRWLTRWLGEPNFFSTVERVH